MAKAAGANWTRLHDAGLEYIGWWNLEPEKGQWRFFDKEIKRYREFNVKVYGELGTAPKWASYYADAGIKSFGYFDKFFQPKNLSDYGNYVKVVTSRYKGVIDDWDVWNEPWLGFFWPAGYDKSVKEERRRYYSSENPQKDYAALMKTAYEAAKLQNPKACVVGFNTTTGNNQGTATRTFVPGTLWTKGVLENGGMNDCDALCFHEYMDGISAPGSPKDPMLKRFDDTWRPVAEKYGKMPKPVWMTEGSPSHGEGVIGFGLYKESIPFPNSDSYVSSSNKLVKYMLSLSSFDVKRWFLYSMHCHDGRPNSDWAALVTPDGALHPSGAAHSALARFIEGRKFVKSMPAGKEAWTVLFEGADGAVAALSGSVKENPVSISVPDEAEAFDIFGNPLEDKFDFDGSVVYLSFKDLAAAEKGLAKLEP